MKRLLLVLLVPVLLAAVAWGQGSVVAPSPQWKVHEGDNLAWAAPTFDDSGWTASPTPPRRYNTSQLFRRQPGYRWYRATFHVPPWMLSQQLAIGIGALDEVYDVYVEGVLAGRFGKWEPEPQAP